MNKSAVPQKAAALDADFSIFHDDVRTPSTAPASRTEKGVAPVNPTLRLLTVTATVTNTGKVAGDEVVQLYVRSPEGSGDRRRHHLEGFTRVSLKPGESKRVRFELTAAQVAQFGKDGRQTLAKGLYRIFVGGGQPGYCDNTRCMLVEL